MKSKTEKRPKHKPIKWKGKIIKNRTGEQYINCVVNALSKWRCLTGVHNTHKHKAALGNCE